MIRDFFIRKPPATSGTGIQPTASLVLGHNYEQNGNDVTGNFPLQYTSPSPTYANNWAAQGYGLTGFTGGTSNYYVNSSINSTFQSGVWTIAWHMRTGATQGSAPVFLADGSTFSGIYCRFNSGLQLSSGGSIVSGTYTFAANTNIHIAMTYNAGTANIYLNGSNVGSGLLPGVSAGGTQYILGKELPSDWAWYDYGVWNIAMNSTQINNIMNNLVP